KHSSAAITASVIPATIATTPTAAPGCGQWLAISSPNVGPLDNILHGVTTVSANDIWAVGAYSGVLRTLIEHWDGSQWSIVPSPSPGSTENELYAIAAVNTNDIWAVGFYANNEPRQTLIER